MKKLICHCGEVELEIKESEGALNKFLRCNYLIKLVSCLLMGIQIDNVYIFELC